MNTEAIIHRARNLLGYMDFVATVETLVECNVSRELAYLCTVAATIMLSDSRGK